MGQKVHPVGIRLGFIKTWDAKWFAGKNFSHLLHEDIALREFIKKKLYQSGVGKVKIERAGKSVRVDIHTARPGLVIGKRGADIENLISQVVSAGFRKFSLKPKKEKKKK